MIGRRCFGVLVGISTTSFIGTSCLSSILVHHPAMERMSRPVPPLSSLPNSRKAQVNPPSTMPGQGDAVAASFGFSFASLQTSMLDCEEMEWPEFIFCVDLLLGCILCISHSIPFSNRHTPHEKWMLVRTIPSLPLFALHHSTHPMQRQAKGRDEWHWVHLQRQGREREDVRWRHAHSIPTHPTRKRLFLLQSGAEEMELVYSCGHITPTRDGSAGE